MPEEKNTPIKPISRLNQWPCQIRLLPVKAPFYDGAKLLIAADCTAYAYADMHENFMKGRITLIGCPKLDNVDYTEKLTEIITNNEIQSIVIVRMEVPCCGGLQRAAECPEKQWKIHSLAGCDDFQKWKDCGLNQMFSGKELAKPQSE